MKDIKIIALDLDGTLLNSKKEISERTKNALRSAAEKGVEIVPTTGRLYAAMPDSVRNLDFIHYSVNVNGATVFDLRKKKTIINIGMDVEYSCRVMSLIDKYDVIYDCYIDDIGYMNAEFINKADQYVDPTFLKLVKDFRVPVEELKAHISALNKPVHKIQLMKRNPDYIHEVYLDLMKNFPEADITSSIKDNIEICAKHANKGESLLKLGDYLGIPRECIMACGDGGNDVNMLKHAGFAVAMENGIKQIKEIADYVAPSCDEDGVAEAVEKFVL